MEELKETEIVLPDQIQFLCSLEELIKAPEQFRLEDGHVIAGADEVDPIESTFHLGKQLPEHP